MWTNWAENSIVSIPNNSLSIGDFNLSPFTQCNWYLTQRYFYGHKWLLGPKLFYIKLFLFQIISAAHCFVDAKKLTAYFTNGRKQKIEKVNKDNVIMHNEFDRTKKSSVNDICLIKMDLSNIGAGIVPLKIKRLNTDANNFAVGIDKNSGSKHFSSKITWNLVAFIQFRDLTGTNTFIIFQLLKSFLINGISNFSIFRRELRISIGCHLRCDRCWEYREHWRGLR